MTPFFFRSQPKPGWKKPGRCLFWLWQLLCLTAGALGIGALSLRLAIGPYPTAIFWGYWDHPILIAFNLLPPVALALLFYALTRRTWAAFALDAAVVLGLSAGNYYKLLFRDDPLLFGDLLLLKEAGNMAGKYQLVLNFRLGATLACVAMGTLALALAARGKPPKHTRARACLGLFSAGLLFGLFPVLTSGATYNQTAFYENLDSQWSATQQYLARGFVYPFLHSISSASEAPPAGYSAGQAAQMLDAFPAADIPEDKKVNVVGVMLEAFQDFSRFGTPELTHDVYADYHRLEAESYTGNLVTNIFAGGTVDTERCFLTGYSRLPDFRGNVNSYPWYFRSQGYQVTGMHPCMSWFYNRVNVNEHLGFQDYAFMEDRFRALVNDPTATNALDNVFFPELMREIAERQEGAPLFSFSVSYQGHGPYASDVCYWGDVSDYVPADAPYTQEEQYILANYFGSVEDTISHLVELRDFLADQEEPYVLVVFGDHNPWMGDGNSVYKAMGLNLDQSTQEGFANYYSTRYLIWANDLAKETLGNDFVGDGPDLGPYFLMNELFALCGWEGPSYLQSLNAIARQVPVQNTSGIYLEDGVFTAELSPEGAALTQDYNSVQFYERHHFRYGELAS